MKKIFVALMLFSVGAVFGQLHPPLYQVLPDARLSISTVQESAEKNHDVFEQGNNSGERKSVALAAAYSLLLPGMGELYAGNYSVGKYFTIAEGALIVALVGMDRYANWLQNDALQYAVQHARVNVDGKDDQYYKAIGNFNDVNAYNAEMLRSRDPEKTYDPNPNSPYYWQWDSKANRVQYRDLRVSSDERFNDTRFIAAVIGINHLVSAINAARSAISHNKSLQHSNAIDLHAEVIGGFTTPMGIRLTLTRTF